MPGRAARTAYQNAATSRRVTRTGSCPGGLGDQERHRWDPAAGTPRRFLEVAPHHAAAQVRQLLAGD